MSFCDPVLGFVGRHGTNGRVLGLQRQRTAAAVRVLRRYCWKISVGPRRACLSRQVYSAFRLVKRAADAGKKIVVVNQGHTRAERSGLDVMKASFLL